MVTQKDKKSTRKKSRWSWLQDPECQKKVGFTFPQVKPSLVFLETPSSLDRKVPLISGPSNFVVLCTTKIGTKRFQVPEDAAFDLSDLCLPPLTYNFLHDPHLNEYLRNPVVRTRLTEKGLVSKDGFVKCTIKEFNDYRQWVRKLKLDKIKQERQLNLRDPVNGNFLTKNEVLQNKVRQDRVQTLFQRRKNECELERKRYAKYAEERETRIDKMRKEISKVVEMKQRQRNSERMSKLRKHKDREREGDRIRIRILVHSNDIMKKRQERVQNLYKRSLQERESRSVELWKRRQAYCLKKMDDEREWRKALSIKRIEGITKRNTIYERQRKKGESYMEWHSKKNRKTALSHLKEASNFLDKIEARKTAGVEKWRKKIRMYEERGKKGCLPGLQRRTKECPNKRMANWNIGILEDIIKALTDDIGQAKNELGGSSDDCQSASNVPSVVSFGSILVDEVEKVYSEMKHCVDRKDCGVLEIPGLSIEHTISFHEQLPCIFEQEDTEDALENISREVTNVVSVMRENIHDSEGTLKQAIKLVKEAFVNAATKLGYTELQVLKSLNLGIPATEKDMSTEMVNVSIMRVASSLGDASENSASLEKHLGASKSLSGVDGFQAQYSDSVMEESRVVVNEALKSAINSLVRTPSQYLEDQVTEDSKLVVEDALRSAACSLGYTLSSVDLEDPVAEKSKLVVQDALRSDACSLGYTASSVDLEDPVAEKSKLVVGDALRSVACSLDYTSSSVDFEDPVAEKPKLFVEDALRSAACSLGYMPSSVDLEDPVAEESKLVVEDALRSVACSLGYTASSVDLEDPVAEKPKLFVEDALRSVACSLGYTPSSVDLEDPVAETSKLVVEDALKSVVCSLGYTPSSVDHEDPVAEKSEVGVQEALNCSDPLMEHSSVDRENTLQVNESPETEQQSGFSLSTENRLRSSARDLVETIIENAFKEFLAVDNTVVSETASWSEMQFAEKYVDGIIRSSIDLLKSESERDLPELDSLVGFSKKFSTLVISSVGRMFGCDETKILDEMLKENGGVVSKPSGTETLVDIVTSETGHGSDDVELLNGNLDTHSKRKRKLTPYFSTPFDNTALTSYMQKSKEMCIVEEDEADEYESTQQANVKEGGRVFSEMTETEIYDLINRENNADKQVLANLSEYPTESEFLSTRQKTNATQPGSLVQLYHNLCNDVKALTKLNSSTSCQRFLKDLEKLVLPHFLAISPPMKATEYDVGDYNQIDDKLVDVSAVDDGVKVDLEPSISKTAVIMGTPVTSIDSITSTKKSSIMSVKHRSSVTSFSSIERLTKPTQSSQNKKSEPVLQQREKGQFLKKQSSHLHNPSKSESLIMNVKPQRSSQHSVALALLKSSVSAPNRGKVRSRDKMTDGIKVNIENKPLLKTISKKSSSKAKLNHSQISVASSKSPYKNSGQEIQLPRRSSIEGKSSGDTSVRKSTGGKFVSKKSLKSNTSMKKVTHSGESKSRVIEGRLSKEIVRKSSSPNKEISRTTSSPNKEIPRTTSSSPNKEIPRTTSSSPNKEIPRTTSSPNKEITRTTSSPNKEIPHITSSLPKKEIPRTTSSSNKEISRTTLSPNKEIPRVTSSPNKDTTQSPSKTLSLSRESDPTAKRISGSQIGHIEDDSSTHPQEVTVHETEEATSVSPHSFDTELRSSHSPSPIAEGQSVDRTSQIKRQRSPVLLSRSLKTLSAKRSTNIISKSQSLGSPGKPRYKNSGHFLLPDKQPLLPLNSADDYNVDFSAPKKPTINEVRNRRKSSSHSLSWNPSESVVDHTISSNALLVKEAPSRSIRPSPITSGHIVVTPAGSLNLIQPSNQDTISHADVTSDNVLNRHSFIQAAENSDQNDA